MIINTSRFAYISGSEEYSELLIWNVVHIACSCLILVMSATFSSFLVISIFQYFFSLRISSFRRVANY